MGLSVFDLHCDLLGSIEWGKGEFDFESPQTCCSLPQLEAGGVKLQVLAVAGVTNQGSTISGEKQVKLYEEFLVKYPERVGRFSELSDDSKKVHCLLAIENASTLAEEDDPLEKVFERFTRYNGVEKILYVSLTWNQENRFGGGNASKVGLKEDGEEFLSFISGKKVAIDFSHTSDALVGDILNHIDKKGLVIPVMASHSNFRSVKDHLRNLTDEFASEIIRRGGVIGINFVKRFVGMKPEDFVSHIRHGFDLGGKDAICIGADFYGALDIPEELCPGRLVPPFFEDFPNSSCCPDFQSFLKKSFSDDEIKAIFHKNVERYLQYFR